MSKEQVIDYLAKTLKKNNLAQIDYKEAEFEITLKTSVDTANVVTTTSDSTFTSADIVSETVDEGNFAYIKCPLVGHFYLTKTPVDPPLIKVGDQVNVGDVVGILQAMKVSNEIKSDIAGRVVAIQVESGDFVDFDFPLIKLELN